jgi:hypothetical protein
MSYQIDFLRGLGFGTRAKIVSITLIKAYQYVVREAEIIR